LITTQRSHLNLQLANGASLKLTHETYCAQFYDMLGTHRLRTTREFDMSFSMNLLLSWTIGNNRCYRHSLLEHACCFTNVTCNFINSRFHFESCQSIEREKKMKHFQRLELYSERSLTIMKIFVSESHIEPGTIKSSDDTACTWCVIDVFRRMKTHWFIRKIFSIGYLPIDVHVSLKNARLVSNQPILETSCCRQRRQVAIQCLTRYWLLTYSIPDRSQLYVWPNQCLSAFHEQFTTNKWVIYQRM
jgi:hypothetical protein